MYLIGVWLGEDQRTKHRRDISLKGVGLRLEICSTTPHSIMNTTGRMYVTIYLEGLADMAASNWLTSMVENNP